MPSVLLRAIAVTLIAALASCEAAPRRAAGSIAIPVVDAAVPADTHVLDLADGTEVWLTAGRMGKRASGEECRERGIALRKEGRHLIVPLLYTLDTPTERGGELIAVLASDCIPGAAYRIDPLTGQPSRRDQASR
ncbi:MAG: hypothetical protein ABIQ41_11470 [Gemmatimonadales bacterium]